ncbi:hypothetical protein F4819DRAFT_491139 [Hypoxylon fuscum]|nr:hypothetical protein F4819DRAFT_491139 [Hypoxylon fuscum]
MEHRRPSVAPVSSRSWRVAKVALQLLSLGCCGIVLGLSVATTWEGGAGIGVLTVPIAGATAAWTLAELFTLCARRRSAPGRGIHPGAHVGVQLVLFLAQILALFYSCMLWRSVQRSVAPCNTWARDPDDPDWVSHNATAVDAAGDRYASVSSFWCPESYRDLVNNSGYRSAVQTLIAFCALLWAIHFSLFVRACVETQRRNSEAPVLVVYPQPMWPAPYGAGQAHGYGPQGGPIPTKEMNYR